MSDIICGDGRIYDGVYTQDPYWIFITVPYAFVDTFDRGKMAGGASNGFRIVTSSEALRDANRVQAPLLFDQQVVRWTLQDAKASHIHGLNLELVNGDNSLALFHWVNPGDWCAFWAFNNRVDYERIRARLVKEHGCRPWDGYTGPSSDGVKVVNGVSDGLKFLGRITSVQHHESRLGGGQFDVGWSVQAQAFTELDMTIYYNDLVAFKYANAYQFWPDFGVSLRKLLVHDPGKNQGYVCTDTFVPAVIKVGLGVGPGQLSKDKGDTEVRQKQGGNQLAASPNVSFEIPNSIARILGRQSAKTFADILVQIIGVQSYSDAKTSDPAAALTPQVSNVRATTKINVQGGLFSGFNGAQVVEVDDGIYYTNRKLNDFYPPDAFGFKDRTIWSFIQGYLNQPINEAYTALRPHPVDGTLQPTLVIRRVPYSSDEYAAPRGAEAASNFLEATAFSELPNWVIPTELISGIQIGRSDALRFNYVHLTPSNLPSKSPTEKERLAYQFAPPLVDEASVRRHGLRMMNTRVAGYGDPSMVTRNQNPAQRYSSFMADILMEAHLRLSGSLTCAGIQEPIQAGDNLTVNGVLYHIESVAHAGGISASGDKHYQTSVTMSHGLPVRLLGQRGRLQEQDQRQVTEDKDFLAMLEQSGSDREVVEDLQKDLDSRSDPDSSKVYRLRNQRMDLDDIGLIGAKTSKDRR